MAQSFGTWRTNEYPAGDAPFNTALMGGPQPYWRDPMDLRRSGWRSTPEAQYPDGYLGTVNSRRGDRLLDGLKQRQAQRPAQRGIHKGDRIDTRDYFWPPEFDPEAGLRYQALAEDTPEGWVVPRYISAGFNNDPLAPDLVVSPPRRVRGVPSAAEAPVPPSVERAVSLRRLAPPWAGTPGMVVAGAGLNEYR